MVFRREQGNCRICFTAEIATDVQLSGKNTKAVTKVMYKYIRYIHNSMLRGIKNTHHQEDVLYWVSGAELATLERLSAIHPWGDEYF